jgi:hypothetical protein
MRRFIVPLIFVLTGFAVLLMPETAEACGRGPSPVANKNVSADGKFLVIWRYSEKVDKRRFMRPFEEETTKIYPSPGLYRNDGSIVPLWKMPYQDEQEVEWIGDVYVSADGNSVVKITESTFTVPLAYYHKGKLLKTYSFDQVFADQSWGADCKNEWIKNISYNSATGLISIQHLRGDIWHFDVSTGNNNIPPREIEIFLLVCLSLFLTGGYCLYKGYKQYEKIYPQT